MNLAVITGVVSGTILVGGIVAALISETDEKKEGREVLGAFTQLRDACEAQHGKNEETVKLCVLATLKKASDDSDRKAGREPTWR